MYSTNIMASILSLWKGARHEPCPHTASCVMETDVAQMSYQDGVLCAGCWLGVTQEPVRVLGEVMGQAWGGEVFL